jgi:hypothetical protein
MYKGVQLEFFMAREIMVSQLISMVNWNIGQNVTVNKIKSLNKIHITSTMISFYLNVWNILSYLIPT